MEETNQIQVEKGKPFLPAGLNMCDLFQFCQVCIRCDGTGEIGGGYCPRCKGAKHVLAMDSAIGLFIYPIPCPSCRKDRTETRAIETV